MHARKTHRSRTGSLISALLVASMLGGAVAPMAAQAKTQNVLRAGHFAGAGSADARTASTDRTYNTPQGLSLWMNSLPIQQGDKIKLNVFAATGGADLKQIIVRLDND